MIHIDVLAKAKKTLDDAEVPQEDRLFWVNNLVYETFNTDKCLSKYTSHTNKDRTMTDIQKQAETLSKELADIKDRIFSFAYKYNFETFVTFEMDYDYELPEDASYEDMKNRAIAINEGRVDKKLVPVIALTNNCENTIRMSQQLVNKINSLIDDLQPEVDEYNTKSKQLGFLQKAQRSLNDAELVKENNWLFNF